MHASNTCVTVTRKDYNKSYISLSLYFWLRGLIHCANYNGLVGTTEATLCMPQSWQDIDPFQASFPFQYLLINSNNFWLFDVVEEYENEALAWNGLSKSSMRQ